jgi:hypothetical protein
MKKITIYDPAMCCSTGVCGTEVDAKVVQFASDLAWLKQQGGEVERFNLAQQPAAFVSQPLVRDALASLGNDCLPLVLVDGVIATRSIYPTREQLATLAGVTSADSCCGGGEGEAEGCCGGDENSTCCQS